MLFADGWLGYRVFPYVCARIKIAYRKLGIAPMS
jgi:hypothetical protein